MDEEATTTRASRPSVPEMVRSETQKQGRRRWAWLAAALGLAGVAAGAYLLRPRGVPLEARFEVAPIEAGSLVRHVSATGRLEARATVDVGAEISGRIAEVHVAHDERVERGQLLASFDTESLEAQLEQAEAQVRVARANLAQARVEKRAAERAAKRSRTLHDRGIEPAARLEDANTGVERAQVALNSAGAQLELQRATRALALATLKDAEIRSPIAGLVIRVDIDPGQTVSAALQTPTLFVIAEDLTQMRVTASIDEADIGEVAVGQAATFTVDAYPGESFEAVVSEVRNAGEIVQNVVTYQAILDVENPTMRLKPGMTASVKIETGRVEAPHIVPTAALHFTPPLVDEEVTAADVHGSGAGVWVIADDELDRIAVEARLADDTRTAVGAEALAGHQQVLVGLTPRGKEAFEKEAASGG